LLILKFVYFVDAKLIIFKKNLERLQYFKYTNKRIFITFGNLYTLNERPNK